MGYEVLLVPAILGIVQAIKMVGLPSQWAALVSLALGIGSSFLFGIDILTGIVYGLSAAGLWSGTKATMGQ